MTDEEYYKKARAAGFTDQQARFFAKCISWRGHEHTSDQITDFDKAVREVDND